MCDQVSDFLESQFFRYVSLGMKEDVARALVELFEKGKLMPSEVDSGTMTMLADMSPSDAIQALADFDLTDLSTICNKAVYLTGLLRAAVELRTARPAANAPSQGSAQFLTDQPMHGEDHETHDFGFDGRRAFVFTADRIRTDPSITHVYGHGPDARKLLRVLDRVPYTLEIGSGHRKYSSPEHDNSTSSVGGNEVFLCRIPMDVFEDELLPLLELCGPVHQLRLMIDPMTGWSRGYGFCRFASRDAANRAVRRLDDFELRKNRKIGVSLSQTNTRLFVSNIPKNKDKEELLAEFSRHSPGLKDVIIYRSPDDKKKNRGFCFLEYENHKAATQAKRKLGSGRIRFWNCDIIVDWADPLEEPGEEIMSKVKVLYVRNLTQRVTEDEIREAFVAFGVVERVKKLKDYAFVHFSSRENARRALEALNGVEVGGAPMEVTWAKPPSDKRKKEEMLRKREIRMTQLMYSRGKYWSSYIPGAQQAPPFGPDVPGLPLFGPMSPFGPPSLAGACRTVPTPFDYHLPAGMPMAGQHALMNAGFFAASIPGDIFSGGFDPFPGFHACKRRRKMTYSEVLTAADYWDDFGDFRGGHSPAAAAASPTPNGRLKQRASGGNVAASASSLMGSFPASVSPFLAGQCAPKVPGGQSPGCYPFPL